MLLFADPIYKPLMVSPYYPLMVSLYYPLMVSLYYPLMVSLSNHSGKNNFTLRQVQSLP
jgi:hypothetical protein